MKIEEDEEKKIAEEEASNSAIEGTNLCWRIFRTEETNEDRLTRENTELSIKNAEYLQKINSLEQKIARQREEIKRLESKNEQNTK